MTVKPKPLTVRIKRGDDFRLQMAVRDRLNEDAVAAYEEYQTAYVNWREAVNADPPNNDTIANTLLIKNNLYQDYEELTLVDITGWTIRCAISWGGKTYAEFQTTILNSTQGAYETFLPSSVSAALKPREYTMEVRFTKENQEVVSSSDVILIIDRNVLDT